MDNVTARYGNIGMASGFWFAHRGFKVLCDKRVRARRFKTEAAALKAGNAAAPESFH